MAVVFLMTGSPSSPLTLEKVICYSSELGFFCCCSTAVEQPPGKGEAGAYPWGLTVRLQCQFGHGNLSRVTRTLKSKEGSGLRRVVTRMGI